MDQEYFYYITLDNLMDEDLLRNIIYPNTQLHYYLSDDWSCDFYIESSYSGFISTCLNINSSDMLLPEIQTNYAMLEWNNLTIPKKVKKIIESESFQNNDFYLRLNGDIDNTLKKVTSYHKDNWLLQKYSELLTKLAANNDNRRNFNIITTELCCAWDNEIIAGEIGYGIGSTYTSLTGFCDRRNKQFNNFGKLQLVLLAKTLEYHGYHFWNLGHPYMDYKFELGAHVVSRADFLKKWIPSRDQILSHPLQNECIFDCNFYMDLF